MSLKDLNLRNQYRSESLSETLRERHDLLDDFYIPSLSQSIAYDRSVGFFSSKSLSLVAQGLTVFVRSQGKMRLVASPHLAPEDIEAIAQGIQQRDTVIARLKIVQERVGQLFRLQLENRVQEIFRTISFTNYQPRLNEKYELTLEEQLGDSLLLCQA